MNIMRTAVMQPYFMPYIGYFQLINAVDVFVVYDNIQFTKKGWFHRNRILVNGKNKMFSVPLRKESDYLYVAQRELADSFDNESKKIIRKIKAAYQKAPYYKEVIQLVEECFQRGSGNLFDFLHTSLKLLTQFLQIDTKIIISSAIDIDHTLKSQDKVVAICKNLNADIYINAIGGQDLYEVQAFGNNGIELHFIKTKSIKYKQFDNEFVPWLSIIDVMMFNSKERIKEYLNYYYSLI
jgi:hypothetical protein